ncbi:hypothetical protein BKN14_02445 [Candidatus Gracilibacteria bacterium HOT-871]|nr:hypothetical protein BKN14_02445 [Candidatus Gracilibacteria bacterium HOT-871]RKW21689.1 MAG: hypothetical protein D8B46_07000 [Candidatus Gracilibacteria bacterium]
MFLFIFYFCFYFFVVILPTYQFYYIYFFYAKIGIKFFSKKTGKICFFIYIYKSLDGLELKNGKKIRKEFRLNSL